MLETLPLALYNYTHTASTISHSSLPVFHSYHNQILQPFFGGPRGAYPEVSFIDVLDMSRVELISNFAGKYVFVGESGTHIKDALVSPVTNTMMDGVEFHAHFLD